MIERYDAGILQTKTATRMVQVIRELLKLIPVTRTSESIGEAESIVRLHKERLKKIPHVHGETYDQQAQEVLDYKPKWR